MLHLSIVHTASNPISTKLKSCNSRPTMSERIYNRIIFETNVYISPSPLSSPRSSSLSPSLLLSLYLIPSLSLPPRGILFPPFHYSILLPTFFSPSYSFYLFISSSLHYSLSFSPFVSPSYLLSLFLFPTLYIHLNLSLYIISNIYLSILYFSRLSHFTPSLL